MAYEEAHYQRLPQPSSSPTTSTSLLVDSRPSWTVAEATIGEWHGARERGETGVEPADGALAFSVFEIQSVPDFSSFRFPDLAQLDEVQRIKRVGERQNQFIAACHSLGGRFGVTLRYFYERQGSREGRIRLFIIGRSYAETETEATRGILRFRDIMHRAFPAEYRLTDLKPDEDAAVIDRILSLNGVSSIVEILKPEQKIDAWHSSYCGFSFYYWPLPFAAAENDMIDCCRALTNDAYNRSVIVDLCLVPTRPLTETERNELGSWLSVCERWGREQRVSVGGGLFTEATKVEFAADPHAQEARKGFSDLLQRYGGSQARCFIYSFRAMWWEDESPRNVAASLASLATISNSGVHICEVSRNHQAFQRALNAARYCYVTPAVCREDVWHHPEAPETLRRLHRMVDVKEAGGFFRLPIPGRDGCPGMSVDSGFIEQTSEGRQSPGASISIGFYAEGSRKTADECSFEIQDLSKHCLIVGTPGSGKTTLCSSLLTQLWEKEIPFIVLEPAKTEYRALKSLPAFRDRMLIFSPGNERVSPFRFNPFEVMDGFAVSEHISALLDCFAGAFSLWDPLPMIVEQAIRGIYADKGWSEYGAGGEDPSLVPPTMEEFYTKALAVAQSTSYRGEFAGNLRGALETRLGAFIRGPKGRCFNSRRSVPARMLMESPVIFELDALNDEEKALMMMFILTMVRQYAKATRKSNSPLKHVVLVEEAHNVIGRGDQSSGGEHRANPKEKAIRFFTRMLAEMRALGEGLMVADQLPTAIAPEVLKLTNIKVMHRLVSFDDRAELGRAMILDEGQMQHAAALPPGQSFVFKEGDARARYVVDHHFKVDSMPGDDEVREWMTGFAEREDVRTAYLPYFGCAGYCTSCNPRVREQNERLVEQRRPIIAKAIVRERFGTRLPVAIAIAHFSTALDADVNDKVRLGCAAVHFIEKIAKHLPR